MEKSIFTKPLFINPQAYFVIPELSIINKCIPFEFGSDTYTFKINTDGIIDSKIINTNKETILHLDLILNTGNVVLGEWILDGDTDGLIIKQQSNIITIEYDAVKPIASYRCYDKTNEDEDRDVLKDLTGNGHDIQLYNFAFAESSGYGKYPVNFTKWDIEKNYAICENYKKVIIYKPYGFFAIFYTKMEVGEKLRVKITGISNTGFTLIHDGGGNTSITVTEDGIYEITQLVSPMAFKLIGDSETANVTIEQIPDYQGALVSDGVDDYGFCENFPILTKENGYTVCVIRKNLQDIYGIDQCFISNRKRGQGLGGAFNIEIGSKTNLSNVRTDNFDSTKWLDKSLYPNLFTYQTSKKYNGNALEIGTSEGSNEFSLFKLGNSFSYPFKGALYALEIYDRDLTDEEIAKVKERMIAEYEAKTGNKYTEETA